MKKLLSVILAIFLTTCGMLLAVSIIQKEKSIVKETLPIKYEEIIKNTAEKYDISPSLLFALIYTESRFDPEAESYAGAVGLTQINEETFDWIKWRKSEERDLSFEDVKNPEISVDYGAYLLKHHIDEFEDVDLALCAYNAGRGNVISWLKNDEYSENTENGRKLKEIPFGETKAYVKKIKELTIKYQSLYNIK